MESGVSATEQLFVTLAEFRKEWPKQGWSWDYRFETVASSFHVDLTKQCDDVLRKFMPHVYDHRSIAQAPPHITEVSEDVGGVRADQRIYTAPASGRLAVFGLWWPWGDETTVSLRLGLCGYVGESDLQRIQMDFQAIG